MKMNKTILAAMLLLALPTTQAADNSPLATQYANDASLKKQMDVDSWVTQNTQTSNAIGFGKLKTSKTSAAKSTTISSVAGKVVGGIDFADNNLRQCVLAHAETYGWVYADEVTGLDCDNQMIYDLGGIHYLSRISYLSLSDNHLDNLDALETLGQLKYLYLDNNRIDNATAISNLPKLRSLYLNENQLSSFQLPEQANDLQRLYLYNNQISDISSLSNKLALEYLLLDNNQISDLSPLANLTALNTLFAHTNQISDVTALSNLTALQRLQLAGNQIAQIDALSGLTSLQWLLLGDNQISDIAAVSQMNQLQRLDLDLNDISDISPLSGLTTLQRVYLSNNLLSNISPLSGLTALNRLLLNNNQIVDSSALSNLTALETVYLQYNQLANLSGLSAFTNPNIINISSNPALVCDDVVAFAGLYDNGVVTSPARCPLFVPNTISLIEDDRAAFESLAGVEFFHSKVFAGAESGVPLTEANSVAAGMRCVTSGEFMVISEAVLWMLHGDSIKCTLDVGVKKLGFDAWRGFSTRNMSVKLTTAFGNVNEYTPDFDGYHGITSVQPIVSFELLGDIDLMSHFAFSVD